MPVSWQDAFGPVAGRVRFQRRFHSPTNLEPEEHVILAFEGLEGTAEISVNGTRIASAGPIEDILRCDVTEFLRPFNDLTVDIDFDARSTDRPGGLWKPVAIEIHFVMPG
jgi:beta-galactosidase/beta-glucuronidase